MTYTGDILLKYNAETNEYDIEWTNGQPTMTGGLETCVLLAIFGEPNVQNAMTTDTSEQYLANFPAVVARAKVNDDTRNDGTAALQRALDFLVRDNIASKITVDGRILTANAIGWSIDIEAPTGNTRFAINWERGTLTAGYARTN